MHRGLGVRGRGNHRLDLAVFENPLGYPWRTVHAVNDQKREAELPCDCGDKISPLPPVFFNQRWFKTLWLGGRPDGQKSRAFSGRDEA